MACPKGTTADGFETQFGTNHLGHFVLVNRIASLLKPGSRLVNLSSAGHRFSDVDLEDPNFERTPYTEFGAYGRSKTANVLFAVEFDRRHKERRGSRHRRASRRHPNRAWPLHDAGGHRESDRLDQCQPAAGGSRVQVEKHSTRRGHVGVGRRGRGRGTSGRPLLRGLPCGGDRQDRKDSAAACAPMRSTQSAPKRYGQRAKRWWPNGFERLLSRRYLSRRNSEATSSTVGLAFAMPLMMTTGISPPMTTEVRCSSGICAGSEIETE